MIGKYFNWNFKMKWNAIEKNYEALRVWHAVERTSGQEYEGLILSWAFLLTVSVTSRNFFLLLAVISSVVPSHMLLTSILLFAW